MRVITQVVNRRKRVRLRKKIIRPMVRRPRNWWGVSARAMARPPVDMVVRYHAKVKCLRRWRRGIFIGCAGVGLVGMPF